MNQTEKNNEKILWTKKEVAEQLQVSTKTISRLIAQGLLPFIQIGSSIRIQKTDVFKFLERQKRYNLGCAGLEVLNPKGVRKCLNSAKRRKVSTGVNEVSFGGPLTQRQAVGEFNALLGQPPSGKR